MSLPFSESSRPRNLFSDLAQTALSGSLGFVFMLTALSDAVAQAYRGPDGSDQLQKLLQELESAPKGSPGNILKGLDEQTTPYKVGDMWHYGPYKIKPEVFDLIQAISERNNFPLKIFLDIIARESSFRPNVKSDTGACGLVQFIPSTVRETVFKY
ncbi:MAG TPA: transglycosylase SLT domain-containing protein, partial [Alphaproteobacteria bacterium]|nr:transglycosylase SLT domain-containing protein [Alphaproteobacteria bacterium]